MQLFGTSPRHHTFTLRRPSYRRVTPSREANAPRNITGSAIGTPSCSTQACASKPAAFRRTPIRTMARGSPRATTRLRSALARTTQAESPGVQRSARSTAAPHRAATCRSATPSLLAVGAGSVGTRGCTSAPTGDCAMARRARRTATTARITSTAARTFRRTARLTPAERRRPRAALRSRGRPAVPGHRSRSPSGGRPASAA